MTDRWRDAKRVKPDTNRDVLLRVRTEACHGTGYFVGWWCSAPWDNQASPLGWVIGRWDIDADRIDVLYWRELPPPPKVRKKKRSRK